ncbi:MAG: PhzF family phenazine biosynthesis protein [Chloroflexota bacterium]|nr:PhzF family phenazine biosynthesis protein [Chloroflexota bacterium]
MNLNYHLLDVFSNQPFGGNQLAVFADPPLELPASTMQLVAKELNLSEVTFVFPPADYQNDFRLRIFTPDRELPMAGHPTVGTAFLLARLGMIKETAKSRSLSFEEGIGSIQVTVESDEDGRPESVLMRQPIPQFLDIYEDREAIARMLSLRPEDLQPKAPLQVLDNGLPFLFVAVQSLDAIRRLSLRLDLWQGLLLGKPGENVFVATTQTEHPGSTVHSRMFAPALGVAEDPATGSASGSLGVYLLKYGLVDSGEIVSEQGIEMGRPSFININVERQGEKFTAVTVGGACVYMGQGTLIRAIASKWGG